MPVPNILPKPIVLIDRNEPITFGLKMPRPARGSVTVRSAIERKLLAVYGHSDVPGFVFRNAEFAVASWKSILAQLVDDFPRL